MPLKSQKGLHWLYRLLLVVLTFNHINSSMSERWDTFPFICVFLNFFHKCPINFRVEIFHLLGLSYSYALCCFWFIVNEIDFLISFSENSLSLLETLLIFVYWFFILQLYWNCWLDWIFFGWVFTFFCI